MEGRWGSEDTLNLRYSWLGHPVEISNSSWLYGPIRNQETGTEDNALVRSQGSAQKEQKQSAKKSLTS